MKFLQFAAKVARIAESPSVVRRDPELTIKIHRPGSLGPTPSVEIDVEIDDIYAGFDWDVGQVILFSKQQLTELDPQQLCPIEESVRKGQSWHAYQAHKKHRDELKAMEDQRDTLLAVLERIAPCYSALLADCGLKHDDAVSEAIRIISHIKGGAV